MLAILSAATLSAQAVSYIAQGFQTSDANVVAGSLVSLKAGTSQSVELSDRHNVDQMVGIAGQSALIELNSTSASVQVIINGVTPALVSDINGEVKTGDKITSSPIAGVGMKATNSGLVIGTAQADLKSAKTDSRTVTDKQGHKKTVKIGSIALQIDKVYYQSPDEQNSFLPVAFQNFADNLAGRPVSPLRVMFAGLLLVLLFVTVVVLLHAAVRSSLLAIGRNPLSERSVYGGLLQVGLTVFGVMAFTVLLIYLILTF